MSIKTPTLKPAAYHGISRGKFAPRTGEGTYAAKADMIPVKYLKNVSIQHSVESEDVYADNYAILTVASEGNLTGSIGSTASDPDLETAIGWRQKLADGSTAEVAIARPVPGAFYYETILEYESKPAVTMKVWLLNLTLTKPNTESRTKNPGPDFGDYVYNYSAKGETLMTHDGAEEWTDEYGLGRRVQRVISLPGDAGYKTFGDAVPEPKAPAPDTTLKSLKVGSETLAPEFSPEVKAYSVASTSTQTAKIDAEATDPEAVVAIKNGADSVANGGNATWKNGSNTLTVTVTNGTAKTEYKVTVNYSAGE